MPNLNVAVLGAPDYSKGLGKKSTTSDITSFDLKQGDSTVSMIEPTKYPEKLSSLFHATSLADAAIVVVEKIGPEFGEMAIMLDCLDVKRGYLVLRNYITQDQVAAMIKGTVLERYTVVDDDPVRLRQTLLSETDKMKVETPEANGMSGSVAVDHYFDVKGVGTVVLGCVAKGSIRKHDSVRVLPTGKETEIRSIQKHDDDFEEATRGDRVGLALKGVTVDDLDRGTVLTNDKSMIQRSKIEGRVHMVKYWQKPITEGMVLHIGNWMQFEPGRVSAVDSSGNDRGPMISLEMSKDLVFAPGSEALVTQLDGCKLRVVGTIDLN